MILMYLELFGQKPCLHIQFISIAVSISTVEYRDFWWSF